MAAALPSLRADYRAIETYRVGPGAAVASPITALTGDNDPKTTVGEARHWRVHTTGEFDLHVFPGGHFYLVEQMPGVIDVLDRCLTAAAESAGAAGTPLGSARR